MGTRWVRSLCAMAFAALAVGSLGIDADAAPGHLPSRACEQPYAFGAWLSYTQAQSFAALGADARAVDVRLVFLRTFHGTVGVRLVWHPAQASNGQLLAGEVVQEGTATANGVAGEVRWVVAPLARSAAPALTPVAGIWALYLDLPVDASHRAGPLAWAGCRWGPQTGAAYLATTLDVIDRAELGLGVSALAPTIARQPLVADPHPTMPAFQYRVWTQ